MCRIGNFRNLWGVNEDLDCIKMEPLYISPNLLIMSEDLEVYRKTKIFTRVICNEWRTSLKKWDRASCFTFSYSVPMHVMRKYSAKPQRVCTYLITCFTVQMVRALKIIRNYKSQCTRRQLHFIFELLRIDIKTTHAALNCTHKT